MPLINYELRDGIAHVRLNRPEAANTFDLPMARALLDIVRAVAADSPRVVYLTGEGKRFCAGGDLAGMLAADDRAAYLTELIPLVETAVRELTELPVPVVAAVHGAVAGGGLALALGCDVVVAARSTQFLTAYSAVGLTPDCGMSYLLPRAVGSHRALDLAITGRVLLAPEAEAWGIVSRVVDDGEHESAGLELATRLAKGAAGAIGQAKRLMRESWETDRAAGGQDEVRTMAAAISGDEARTLIDRFVNKG